MQAKYNLVERTQKQQEAVDRRLERQGSLWPRFPIQYQFVFTKKELNQVKKASKTLEEFKKKKLELINLL